MRNGAAFLPQAIEALLAQTYEDFELLISDNASTDQTAEICLDYVGRDARVRYLRQAVNRGAAFNHNALVPLARGRYFKWASHDDLYAPTLLQRCVEVLAEDPEPILVHCWDSVIDERGAVVRSGPYALDTDSSRPSKRLRSLLSVPDGNAFYGVMRTEVLRRVRPHGSYCHADRTFLASLCLRGRFYLVPEVLYFRRDHPDRASRAPGVRARAAALDPVRANRWHHPVVRMRAEEALGWVSVVSDADLGLVESARSLGVIASGVASGSLERLVGVLPKEPRRSPTASSPRAAGDASAAT